MSQHLSAFYAVTGTSIYLVEAQGEYRSSAKKIALKGASEFPVGSDLGHNHYYMIGIGTYLLAYIPERYGPTHPNTDYERNFENINTHWWGYVSSNIRALFETEAEARECFEHNDVQPRDPRWIESTRKVLAMIGDDHPSFFVSHSSSLGLIEAEKQAA